MKDSSYFSHDSDARNDDKILKLRRILGSQGYGIFWMIIESLRNTKNFKLPISSIKELSFDFHESEEMVISIINDFDLFIIDDNHFFYSDSLIRRMIPLEEKRLKMKGLANKRWAKDRQQKAIRENNETNKKIRTHMRTHNEGNVSKVKESKVKESKVKESKVKESNNKPEKSFSDDVIKIYDYSLKQFPDKYHPKTKSQIENWKDTIDKLLRIDNQNKKEICLAIRWARIDSFWSKNFYSIKKLRQKNSQDVMYIDVFIDLMSSEREPKGNHIITSASGTMTDLENYEPQRGGNNG